MKKAVLITMLMTLIIAAQPVPAQAQAATPAPSAADIRRAEELMEIGEEYYYAKNYERAITAVSEVIRLTPNNAMGYFLRSAAYIFTGKHDQALTDVIAGFRIEEDFDIIGEVVFCYLYDEFGTGNDLTRALNVINAAIRIKPNLPDGYSIRGDVYCEVEDYDRAIADYETVLRIDPNDAYAKHRIEYIREQQRWY